MAWSPIGGNTIELSWVCMYPSRYDLRYCQGVKEQETNNNRLWFLCDLNHIDNSECDMPRARIATTPMAFQGSMLTITPHRLPDITTLPASVYAAACLRGQCSLLHIEYRYIHIYVYLYNCICVFIFIFIWVCIYIYIFVPTHMNRKPSAEGAELSHRLV